MSSTARLRSTSSIVADLREESEFCAFQDAKYRADIDGLRAVAVLSVIGYHYFGPLFPGGYVGVDVFFVISGYLLSGIIISETTQGRFSFARFYERRIRRIFPALFVLLVVCAGLAGMFLVTPDLQSYLRSMLAAAWSASNFYFWKTSNYFDSPAADKPLLHTWSLGVEEQFYLLFPIFIYLICRYMKRHLKAAVLATVVISFAFSVIAVRTDQGGAFYLPMARAWELLTGALVFLRITPPLRGKIANELMAVGGMCLIGLAVFRFNLNTRFPGENALLPCLGAAAIIASGQASRTVVHQLLSARPVVFVGLISYSLYLWHWPLLVFSRIAILPGLHLSLTTGRLVLTVVATVIATISWRLVETPFRTGKHRPDRRAVYGFGAACLASVTMVFFLAGYWAPRLRTFPMAANEAGSYIDYPGRYGAEFHTLFAVGSCFLERGQSVSSFQEARCLSQAESEPGVLLFGDSEAANLRYGLQLGFPGVKILQATSSACPPLVQTVIPTTSECREFVHKVMTDFIPRYKIGTVLLSSGWAAADRDNLRMTVEELEKRGVRVIVFGPLPEYEEALPRLLAESISGAHKDYAHENRKTSVDDVDRALSLTARQEWHVPYVSLTELLCPGGVCVEFAERDVPLQFDHVHLTLAGSGLVGRRVAEKFPGLFDAETGVRSKAAEFVR